MHQPSSPFGLPEKGIPNGISHEVSQNLIRKAKNVDFSFDFSLNIGFESRELITACRSRG
ncbi:hypothetical protein B0E43_13955 [Algoriphagus sp. A40]|nr:hypothetical protein B0E43_13955 [Algoriphagus sp. A40]